MAGGKLGTGKPIEYCYDPSGNHRQNDSRPDHPGTQPEADKDPGAENRSKPQEDGPPDSDHPLHARTVLNRRVVLLLIVHGIKKAFSVPRPNRWSPGANLLSPGRGRGIVKKTDPKSPLGIQNARESPRTRNLPSQVD